MKIKEVHDAINLSLSIKHGISRRLIFDKMFQAAKGGNKYLANGMSVKKTNMLVKWFYKTVPRDQNLDGVVLVLREHTKILTSFNKVIDQWSLY